MDLNRITKTSLGSAFDGKNLIRVSPRPSLKQILAERHARALEKQRRKKVTIDVYNENVEIHCHGCHHPICGPDVEFPEAIEIIKDHIKNATSKRCKRGWLSYTIDYQGDTRND